MNDDVKDLLGRAFGDEPPLRLDRDEVIERGRRRLRRKRTFEAGGVVAAVVVAAVGAAMLTSVSGSEPERLPPAASSTYQAPPGPSLPVTTHIKAPPSSVTLTGLSAARLTNAFYAAGVLAAKEIQPLPGQTDAPRFRLTGGQYVFQGDAYQSGRQGLVQVIVGHSVDVTIDVEECATTVPRASDCSVRGRNSGKIVVAHFEDTDGERRTTASAVLADGLRIYAVASNRTAPSMGASAPPNGARVVLSDDELCTLVAKVAAGA